MHGSGKMTYDNGAVYLGELAYDLLDGDGEYTFPDKTVYLGQFKEGLQHGYGCLAPEGQPEEFGFWVDGISVGKERPVEF